MQEIGLDELPDLADSTLPAHPLPMAAGVWRVDLDGVTQESVRSVLDRLPGPLMPVVVGHATRALPEGAAPLLEQLAVTYAPGGPGRTVVATDSPHDVVDAVAGAAARTPVATATLHRLLRRTSQLDVDTGLELESATYSALLASPEFHAWRVAHPARASTPPDTPVLVESGVEALGATLTITLNHPERRNAFSAAMRDALAEALRLALVEGSSQVALQGAGEAFCSGGDLAEFGTTTSVAAAHLLRLEQHCGRLVADLGDRLAVELHGACVGAGIEVPAFAARVRARRGTWFQLPELSMGLVPGAGGTVSVPRRIGRWRTAHLVLTGARLDLDAALAWGLVDDRA